MVEIAELDDDVGDIFIYLRILNLSTDLSSCIFISVWGMEYFAALTEYSNYEHLLQ